MTSFTKHASDQIYQSIPHREPFLFIDEVLELTPEKAVCQRTVRPEEPQFEGHYPGNPIMPGVLLCEAVFQTAAIYLMQKFQNEGTDTSNKTPILSRIKEVKFKQMVKPGDLIQIEASFIETLGNFHFLKGKITKDSKPVLTLECALALIDENK